MIHKQVTAYLLDSYALLHTETHITHWHIVPNLEHAGFAIIRHILQKIGAIKGQSILHSGLCAWLEIIIPGIPKIFFRIILIGLWQIYIRDLIAVSNLNAESLIVGGGYGQPPFVSERYDRELLSRMVISSICFYFKLLSGKPASYECDFCRYSIDKVLCPVFVLFVQVEIHCIINE